MQVGTENLTMKEALKGMKEQAARMAVEAQQAAAAAAAQREEADTALASVNSELEAERKRITSLQVFTCALWSRAAPGPTVRSKIAACRPQGRCCTKLI